MLFEIANDCACVRRGASAEVLTLGRKGRSQVKYARFIRRNKIQTMSVLRIGFEMLPRSQNEEFAVESQTVRESEFQSALFQGV